MKLMERAEVFDPIYGNRFIDSPPVLELIDSKPVQRLKKINQFGIPNEFYHLNNFSRYEHSIGVSILLKQLGGSEEEQIAGLLHDVSHMAFSHLYDWVVDDYTKPGGTEGRQDDNHIDFITNSEIPKILKKYKYNVKRVTDYHHFGLLEKDAPDLCADRVDYSLREMPQDLVKTILTGLTTKDNQIVCKDYQTASIFAETFLNLQMEHWGGHEAVTRYHLFSKAVKKALNLGIINQTDFLIDDEYITKKLDDCTEPQIFQTLQYLRQERLPVLESGIKAFKKFRYIDPLFISDDKLVRLSSTDKNFKDLLDTAREQNRKGIFVE